ncbi:MAG: choice-of-anchor J domain-containing protein, partial [Flavobacteriales bacterium]|nr:choice-of-anchor J domain-containing protein [Flavobacteriales bacterium]
MKICKLTFFLTVVWISSSSQNILFEESFDAGFPSNWTQNNNGSGSSWEVGHAIAASSPNWRVTENGSFVYTNDDQCNCDKSLDELISPPIVLSGISNAYLGIEFFFNGGSSGTLSETGRVKISTDGGSTFSSLLNLNGSTDWQTQYIDLSSYIGNTIQLAIEYSDDGGWLFGLAIGHFKVFESLNS